MGMPSRRAVVTAGVWTAPAVTVASAAPQLTASTVGPSRLSIELVDPPIGADWQPQYSTPIRSTTGATMGSASLPPRVRITNLGGSPAAQVTGTLALTVGSYAKGGTRISGGDQLRLASTAGWTVTRVSATTGSRFTYVLTQPVPAGGSVELDLRYIGAFAVREQYTVHVEATVASAASAQDGADDKVGLGSRFG
ncbi:hypothetical protein B277_10414 [Janibacter hoylei PVAS-1]|uniref:Uncharacterized protein n=1 Tax=Janibacter hoylei PVAS-1 TaxID=1210046 RepID=K1DX08_9MICO|nr:hypothetical protein [Janibacter hoylei]EKA60914.1 hypothetical protein B277_10414 [Janibacter hoylei PVAS-1]RWU84489.1 hypothetical protein CWN80_04910 [Janibacter hoylei PVAS-1]